MLSLLARLPVKWRDEAQAVNVTVGRGAEATRRHYFHAEMAKCGRWASLSDMKRSFR